MSTLPVVMDFHYKDLVGDRTLPEAYERLLLDAIEGDASLFTRSDEIEQAWKLVSSLLDPWEALPDPPLERYPKGSWGPEKAEALMKQDDHEWIDCCGQPEEAKEMDQQALEDNPLLG